MVEVSVTNMFMFFYRAMEAYLTNIYIQIQIWRFNCVLNLTSGVNAGFIFMLLIMGATMYFLPWPQTWRLWPLTEVIVEWGPQNWTAVICRPPSLEITNTYVVSMAKLSWPLLYLCETKEHNSDGNCIRLDRPFQHPGIIFHVLKMGTQPPSVNQ